MESYAFCSILSCSVLTCPILFLLLYPFSCVLSEPSMFSSILFCFIIIFSSVRFFSVLFCSLSVLPCFVILYPILFCRILSYDLYTILLLPILISCLILFYSVLFIFFFSLGWLISKTTWCICSRNQECVQASLYIFKCRIYVSQWMTLWVVLC